MIEGLIREGRIDLTLTINEQQWQAIAVDVTEGISIDGRIVCEIQTFEDIDWEPLLEVDATALITIDGFEVRRFTRRLAAATFKELKDESLRYELELLPALWFLRFGKNTRKFRDMTPEAIVGTILDEGSVPHRFQNTRPADSRPYCVQYRETNLDFVLRLLEFEGFYYYFEPDGTMVIGDKSGAEDMVPGISLFQLRESEGALAHGEVGVDSIWMGNSLAPGRSTVSDYNWKTPAVSLLQSAAGARDEDLDVYQYPVGYREGGQGSVLARMRMEQLTCEKEYVEGKSTVPQFAPGKQFDFVHAEAVDFSNRYLIVRLEHQFVSARGAESKGSYENKFFAIPAATPWRPPLKTAHPDVKGNHTTMVRGPAGEEIHTDSFGRAKVQFHWDREAKGTDEDSRWIRVLQETSSSMVLYRVGWETLVSYVNGDPDRPIGIGRNINGQMMPTYGQPSLKNMMTIKTESYPGKMGFNELRMDDSVGGMRMDFHAQRDLVNVVENNKTETILSNQTHLVKQGVDRVVEKNQTLSVSGNETKDVQQSFSETVKGTRNETIGGGESVKVKSSSILGVQGNDVENVGSVRFTLAGIGSPSIPSAKDIAQVVVPHTLGAAAQEIGGGMLGGAVGDLIGGASAADIGKSVATGLGEAALGGALEGDIGGALKGAAGLPSGPPDIAGALKSMVSPENLKSMGKDMVMDMLFKGTITRDTRKVMTRMVGGAQIVAAGGNIMNGANYLFTELVGGLKLTMSAQGSIMQSASKFLVHTVGGMIMRKSKEDMSMSSKRSLVTVGGVATLHSDEKIELRGKVIEIEGKTAVTLKSGGLLIELGPDKTTIKGDLRVKSGDKIKIAGNPDKLTA